MPGDDDFLESLPNGTVILSKDDVLVVTKRVRRWARALADVTLDIRFGPSWRGSRLLEALDRLRKLFDDLIRNIGGMIGEHDELQFIIMSPALDVPIFVPLTRWTELTGAYILDQIERTLQSKAEIPLDGAFTVHIGVFRRIGIGKRDGITFAGNFAERERDVGRKRSVVAINNTDNVCLPRAIAVSFFHKVQVDGEPLPGRPKARDEREARRYIAACFELGRCSKATYDLVRRGNLSWQRYAADHLMDAAGIPRDTLGVFDHVPLYETVLGLKIHILGAVGGPMAFLTSKDKLSEGTEHLYLLFNWREGGGPEDGHVHSLIWIRDVFQSAGLCHRCHQDVRPSVPHKCPTKCSKCGACARPDSALPSRDDGAASCDGALPPGESLVTCADCNGVYYGQACFSNHKRPAKRGDDDDDDDDGDGSACQRYWHCPGECRKSYRRSYIDPERHVCYEYRCSKCYVLERNPGEHECYVRAIGPDVPSKRPTRFGVYDFESTVSNADTCGDYVPSDDPDCQNCRPTAKCPDHERCKTCRSAWCGRHNASVHSVNCACFMTFCDRCYDPNDRKM